MAGQVLAAMQQHHPKTLHWYVLYIAAEAGHQGSGIGIALLQPVLEQCDSQQLPAYLEATTEQNRELYRRHGFTDLPEPVLPGDGPVLYRMWREPSSSRLA